MSNEEDGFTHKCQGCFINTSLCVCVGERERIFCVGDKAEFHCKPDFYAVILRLYTHMENEAINCYISHYECEYCVI